MAVKLEAIDTNIILRIILDDVPGMREKALRLLRKDGKAYFVSDIAISEAVYQMERVDKLSRDYIVAALRHLLEDNELRFSPYLETIFSMYLSHPKLSFNDCYLAVEAEKRNVAPLWTLDHKLAIQSDAARGL